MKAVLIVVLLLLAPVIMGPVFEQPPVLTPVPGSPAGGAGHAFLGMMSRCRGDAAGAYGGFATLPGKGRGPPEGAPFHHGSRQNACSMVRNELRCDPAATDITALAKRYRFRGYRRLSERTVLLHDTRRLLYDLIIGNPGIDLTDLASLAGIAVPTARYHVDSLVRVRKVVTLEIGGHRRLYENHGRYDDREKVVLARLWSQRGRRIAELVEARPGITRGEVAEALGISGPSATRRLKQCVSDGIFLEERDGRFSRYYPAGPRVEIFRKA